MTEDMKKAAGSEKENTAPAPETETNVPEIDPEEELPAADGEETENATEEHPRKEKKAEKKLRAELEEARKKYADAEAKSAELLDKYTRLAAEYDNFRKRSQKEKESVHGEAIEDAVKGLLPVIDNLQYASKYGNADPEKFAEGVRLILDKLPENLAKLNVKPFGAPGDTFDPNLHNAVMHVEDEEAGENIVVEEFMKGYMYKGSVVRHSMVKVAN